MENLGQIIRGHIGDSIALKQQILSNSSFVEQLQEAASCVLEAYKRGNKTLLAGNGGSAGDAQHIAGEFVSRFYFDRPALASIALTTDTSVLSAIGNDYGYEHIFARQLEAQGSSGDVFIAISTSGKSKNIIQALKLCKPKGIIAIGLTGQSGGEMREWCDFCLQVPSKETPRIQEAHILIGHIICAIVEQGLFGCKPLS